MKLINIISVLSIWFPLIIGLIHYSKYERKVKTFVLYLIVIAIAEHTALLLAKRNISNLFIYNLLDLITIVFVAIYLIYRDRFLSVIAWGVFLITSYFSITNTSIETHNFNFITIYLYIAISGLYLINKSTQNDEIHFIQTFDFWVSIGFVFCAILTIIVTTYFKIIIGTNPNNTLIEFHNVVFFIATIFQYLFFSKALLCRH